MRTLSSVIVIFTSSYLIGFSGALQPGPLLMVVIGEATRRGFWAGPLMVVGHAATELAMVLLLSIGLSPYLQSRIVGASVGVLGGLYLTWMGINILRGLRGLTLSLQNDGSAEVPSAAPVLTGVWVSLSNPGWLIWWATIGVTYTMLALREGAIGLAGFYTGHILSDLSWYSLVSLVVASGRTIISDALYKGVVGTCGALLLVIGIYFITLGVGYLGVNP